MIYRACLKKKDKNNKYKNLIIIYRISSMYSEGYRYHCYCEISDEHPLFFQGDLLKLSKLLNKNITFADGRSFSDNKFCWYIGFKTNKDTKYYEAEYEVVELFNQLEKINGKSNS